MASLHLAFGGLQIVVELVVQEHACILGIEAEYDTNTKDIQPPQSLGAVVIILRKQGLVYLPNNLACLHRDLHLLSEVFALYVHKELQAVVFLSQVLQQFLDLCYKDTNFLSTRQITEHYITIAAFGPR